ncbi:MAG: hypothetical protein A4E73_01091 [Syntrophaceae bacterium PtaU1.Bin231]|nr:MAG: hypothetical protein A4E73_01091 [Syntrophaceae bacterium PtaU1.Bin231]
MGRFGVDVRQQGVGYLHGASHAGTVSPPGQFKVFRGLPHFQLRNRDAVPGLLKVQQGLLYLQLNGLADKVFVRLQDFQVRPGLVGLVLRGQAAEQRHRQGRPHIPSPLEGKILPRPSISGAPGQDGKVSLLRQVDGRLRRLPLRPDRPQVRPPLFPLLQRLVERGRVGLEGQVVTDLERRRNEQTHGIPQGQAGQVHGVLRFQQVQSGVAQIDLRLCHVELRLQADLEEFLCLRQVLPVGAHRLRVGVSQAPGLE